MRKDKGLSYFEEDMFLADEALLEANQLINQMVKVKYDQIVRLTYIKSFPAMVTFARRHLPKDSDLLKELVDMNKKLRHNKDSIFDANISEIENLYEKGLVVLSRIDIEKETDLVSLVNKTYKLLCKRKDIKKALVAMAYSDNIYDMDQNAVNANLKELTDARAELAAVKLTFPDAMDIIRSIMPTSSKFYADPTDDGMAYFSLVADYIRRLCNGPFEAVEMMRGAIMVCNINTGIMATRDHVDTVLENISNKFNK